MELLITIIVAIFGVIIGSFLNVVVARFDTGMGIMGRSFCFSCKKTLTPIELIPVLSFLWQKGKCSSCKAPIGWMHVLGELGTALIAVVVFKIFGLTLYTLILFVATAMLFAAIMYDLKKYILPDVLNLSFCVLGLVSLFFPLSSWALVGHHFLAGFLIALPFFLLWLFSKGEWMGFGDIKTMIGIGWWLGLVGGVHVVALSFFLGGIVGVFFLCMRLVKNPPQWVLKPILPFGPFLFLGFFLVITGIIDMSYFFPLL